MNLKLWQQPSSTLGYSLGAWGFGVRVQGLGIEVYSRGALGELESKLQVSPLITTITGTLYNPLCNPLKRLWLRYPPLITTRTGTLCYETPFKEFRLWLRFLHKLARAKCSVADPTSLVAAASGTLPQEQ